MFMGALILLGSSSWRRSKSVLALSLIYYDYEHFNILELSIYKWISRPLHKDTLNNAIKQQGKQTFEHIYFERKRKTFRIYSQLYILKYT